METSPTSGTGPKAPLDVIAASLRRERNRIGLSLAAVARKAGIAKSTLSQLETGTGNPSIETLWALAVALDVPFGQIVEPTRPKTQIIRRGEGPGLASEQANYVATLLSSCPPNSRRDIYLISTQPGKPKLSDPHMPGVVEHVVLASGRAKVGLVDEPIEIEPGDYVAYAGDAPHVFEALQSDTTAVMLSEHV